MTTPPGGSPVDLILWETDGADHACDTPWPWGQVRRAPFTPAGGADLRPPEGEGWVLLWDPRLGPPPAGVIPELVGAGGLADVHHAGLLLGMGGLPPEIDLVQPRWWFAVDAPADLRSMSWRASVRACLVRAEVIRRLGGLDPSFETMEGAGLDFGWRCLARGAIVFHQPSLLPQVPSPPVPSVVTLPAHDRHLFFVRHYPRKWARYVLGRRCLGGRPVAEGRAFRGAVRSAATPPPAPPTAVYERSTRPSNGSEPARVSVVLPTLGRPELVAVVLDDLRQQTVRPWEVLLVDQNGAGGGPATDYGPFADLPLEVIRQDATGQWLARNAAVERATGDLLLFLDDDSRIGPDFVQRHLDALADYRADVSAGASLSTVGAPVPENYAFFRAADQFDSGNALVRREVLAAVGGFDHHYDRMRGGDADFGTRVYLAGGLVVHNPRATRTHLKAPSGGLRSFGSWDSYRQKGLLTPKPLPSVVYYSLRYFSARQTREGLLIGLAQSAVPYHLKRRASPVQWTRFLAVELLRSPLTAVRVTRSVRSARHMLAEGPRIPEVRRSPV